MKDTVQELVDALYVMTTSILERTINTWILRLKLKPVTSEIFLSVDNPHDEMTRCSNSISNISQLTHTHTLLVFG